MLQIKPVLHVDDEGHLINVGKVRGRKASVEALAKKMGETALPAKMTPCLFATAIASKMQSIWQNW
jgi:fatty acid-binding protein DegV